MTPDSRLALRDALARESIGVPRVRPSSEILCGGCQFLGLWVFRDRSTSSGISVLWSQAVPGFVFGIHR